MRGREERQAAIREIVRTESTQTQRDIVERLSACGFNCTQATVSRDIAEMGLCKLPEGVYVLAEDLHLQRMLSEFVVCVLRAENLVVIKCQPGTASGVAAAVDDAGLAHALGSVAGNDTVLVVADTTENAKSLQNLIQKLGNAE